jgi:hypothetical protein
MAGALCALTGKDVQIIAGALRPIIGNVQVVNPHFILAGSSNNYCISIVINVYIIARFNIAAAVPLISCPSITQLHELKETLKVFR